MTKTYDDIEAVTRLLEEVSGYLNTNKTQNKSNNINNIQYEMK